MAKKELISSKRDFPNVKVYRHTAKSGRPVYTVTFTNPEAREDFVFWIMWLCMFGLSIPMAVMSPFFWVVPIGLIAWACQPARVPRKIELDFDKRKLFVWKGGWVKVRKDLLLKNMSIEAHPDAEVEWHEKGGKLGNKQKQHCLVGYFGMAGADREVLLCRLEWPRKNSLMEVQQALIWAIEQGTREMAPLLRQQGVDVPDMPPAPGGLAPPLD